MPARKIVIISLILAFPLQAQPLLERLRAEVRAAIAERSEDAPVLRHLEEAATDVEDAVSRVERHVDSSIEFLEDIGPCTSESAGVSASAPAPMPRPHEELQRLPDEVERAFDELRKSREAVEELIRPQSPDRFREAVRNAVATVDEMLLRQRDSSTAANWLRRLAEERKRSTTHQELCRLLRSMGPVPKPFTLSELRRDPLVPVHRLDEAVRRHIDERNESLRRGEWSLGIGAMWTPMKANEDGREETRAGQPIAMLGFRPRPEDLPFLADAPIRPWVQIGSGLEFDEPSFYVGGAIDLGPYALFGVGWTAQQIEDEAGNEEFDGDVYLSMTIRTEKLREWWGGR